MQRLGTIDISFNRYEDGVSYYAVEVSIGKERRSIILPRYDAFLGWIEVFGLPPQNEWVVLRDLSPFTKEATITINGKVMSEQVTYRPGDHSHDIEVVRELERVREVCLWQQQYRDAPERILNKVSFEHVRGSYFAEWLTSIIADPNSLSESEQNFVTEQVTLRGQPDLIIKKTVTAGGEVPPLYYQLFPLGPVFNPAGVTGTVVEVGYLYKDSPHAIDQVHGDWYKQFVFGDVILYVVESSYTSRDIVTEKGTERVKSTYSKELFG